MREKKLSLLITFEATTQAMKLEKVAGQQGVAGRLIPLPPAVSAGCGFAFKAPLEERRRLEELIKECDIEIKEVSKMLL
ncbi:DUF3343 domain-containing protein [Eubacterium oxidoreducens]|uniref:Putative Se/S carrier protein-like domain-containing protein n=1 Tax=Eubacterium oxidoreducens TaxID=1732 RepID=A0A1G6CB28_EUBOX|nr:DUF3343 domain-containing protein [Eubacterium oxidoreducens]SDB30011.1 Protein of unknown function [Eubacterium oxidoreducens]